MAEPYLTEIHAHIQRDEERHKIIVVESVRALRSAGLGRRFIARVFGPLVKRSALLYFRHGFGHHLQRSCAALELPHERILERALDEVQDAHARA